MGDVVEARRVKAAGAVAEALAFMRAGADDDASRVVVAVVHSGVWPKVRPVDVVAEVIAQTGGSL